MSVNVSGLYGLEDRLERVADELRKRNEIEAQKARAAEADREESIRQGQGVDR